jgi:AraC-like DNA-binding protein
MSDPAVSPLTPKVFRFTDIDEFRSAIRNLNVDFTPLVRTISAGQTILNLPGFDINLVKSFPRIIDAQLAPNSMAVGFTMDDGIPIRINGVERDHDVIVLGTNGAIYSAVERIEREYVTLIFSPPIENRGWPETGSNFQIYETSPQAQSRLRKLVMEILFVAPTLVDSSDVPGVASAITESVLAGADAAFAAIVTARWTRQANSARQFKVFQTIREILASNIQNPIYSADLARELGVSVRTIHDSVLRFRGMSLHRYLRLRRLWLVRQRLLTGTQSVKACALACGFWHLSDFAQSYRQHFGESPSQTLARSRKH